MCTHIHYIWISRPLFIFPKPLRSNDLKSVEILDYSLATAVNGRYNTYMKSNEMKTETECECGKCGFTEYLELTAEEIQYILDWGYLCSFCEGY